VVVASLDSAVESTLVRGPTPKPLISSQEFAWVRPSGFQVASPVKRPVASEMARSAPPYTNRAREEPCQGGTQPALCRCSGTALPPWSRTGFGVEYLHVDRLVAASGEQPVRRSRKEPVGPPDPDAAARA
jgi:hypothetical protein